MSVVIPAFNNQDTIRETVSSVIGQSYSNLEIVISDHQSTDGTRKLLSEFDGLERLQITSYDGPAGAHYNWNYVTSLATGEFIMLVPGDDLLDRHSVERHVDALSTHPTAVMSSARRSVIDETGRRIIASRGLPGLRGLYRGSYGIKRSVQLGQNIFGEPMAVMFRREVLQRSGNWITHLPYVIDQGTYFNVLEQGDFVAIPEVLSSFRISRRQLSFHLLAGQADQVKQLHAWSQERWPDFVSRLDRARGDVMVTLIAQARKLVYFTMTRSRPEANAYSNRGD